MYINPLNSIDFYKADHRRQYPEGTTKVYSNFTPRSNKLAILTQLKANGFASTNIVFGIGSFTYQYVTRDTYGFAMKATYGEVNGKGRNIFKDPKTDTGSTKKSAKGLLVVKDGVLYDEQTYIDQGDLKVVFTDGHLLKDFTLAEVRANIKS